MDKEVTAKEVTAKEVTTKEVTTKEVIIKEVITKVTRIKEDSIKATIASQDMTITHNNKEATSTSKVKEMTTVCKLVVPVWVVWHVVAVCVTVFYESYMINILLIYSETDDNEINIK
jgi:hypothetical protein